MSEIKGQLLGLLLLLVLFGCVAGVVGNAVKQDSANISMKADEEMGILNSIAGVSEEADGANA